MKRNIRMQIELTNHCNFKCVYCPHAVYQEEGPSGNVFNRPKGFMSDVLFAKARSAALQHAQSVTIGFFRYSMSPFTLHLSLTCLLPRSVARLTTLK